MARYAIVVDLNRCTGCYGCEVACKNENGIALGEAWNKVVPVGPRGTFPHIEQYWLPAMCQQCEEAPCVHVCPTNASYRNDDNMVLIDKEICIGCKYCMMACPYGVRSWNAREKVVEKCTLCNHLVSAGSTPACVHNCSTQARFFGDLDDPASDPSKFLASVDFADIHGLEDVGNRPVTKYVLSSKVASWKGGGE